MKNKTERPNQLKKQLLCIAKKRYIGKVISRVKQNIFQPVTKPFHTTNQVKQECTTQRDMSTAYILENKKWFLQNFDTPLMRDELIPVIGYDAEKEGGRQILEVIFFH